MSDGGVSGVFEAAVAEAGAQELRLGAPLQVLSLAAAVDAVKQAGMSGDGLGQLLIGGGDQHQRTPAPVLGLQKVEHLAVVSNVSGLQRDSLRQLALDVGTSAAHQPERQEQQRKGILLEQQNDAFP